MLIEPNVDRYYAAVVKLFELLKDQKPLESIELAPGNTNTSLLSEQIRASLHFEVTRAKDRRLETRENPCCFFKVDQRIYATRTKEARDRWMTALRPLKFSQSRGIELENMSHAVMFPEVLDILKGRVSVVTALRRERHERSRIAKKFRMSCHDKTDEPSKTEREEYIRMLCLCGRWDSWQTRTSMIRKILSCSDPQQWLDSNMAKEIEIAANSKNSFKAAMLIKIAFVKWRDYLFNVPWNELIRIVRALSMFNGLFLNK